jgi:hypothetical protein
MIAADLRYRGLQNAYTVRRQRVDLVHLKEIPFSYQARGILGGLLDCLLGHTTVRSLVFSSPLATYRSLTIISSTTTLNNSYSLQMFKSVSAALSSFRSFSVLHLDPPLRHCASIQKFREPACLSMASSDFVSHRTCGAVPR